jgi:hypothetical protein
VILSPYGRGAAEAFVRKQYPNEVREYRRKRSRLNIGLVVFMDADNKSVADRLIELERDLGREKRQPDERIGIFIPKRNIETWIRHLQGKSVDEQTEYPHLDKEGDCKPLVAQLARDRHTPLPEGAPPSLRAACAELERILPVAE